MAERINTGDKVIITGNGDGFRVTEHFFKIGTEAKVVRRDRDNNYELEDNGGRIQFVDKCNFKLKDNYMTLQQLMKDAVKTAADSLLAANNTVTTLEIKVKLRKDNPELYWDQATVSRIMDKYAKVGAYTYTDNGVYRVYSDPLSTVGTNSKPAQVVATAPVQNGRRSAVVKTPRGTKITRKKALELMQNNRGHFFTATFVKKDNTERTINCQYLKDQSNSDLGYVKVREAAKLKTSPNDAIRQINLQTLSQLRIAGSTYKIR